jgi:hypothetical protein
LSFGQGSKRAGLSILSYPPIERLPIRLGAGPGRADLKFVNRVNFPKRRSLRIVPHLLAVGARDVTRIEEALAGNPDQEVRICYFLDIFLRPSIGSVMRNHFRDDARTFIVECGGIGFDEGDVNVMEKRTIGNELAAVNAFGTLLASDQYKSLKNHQVSLP